jgi:hypothetical protein
MRTWSILLRGEPSGRLATIITSAAYWPPPSMSCEATERRPPLVSNQFQPLGAMFSQQGTETSPSEFNCSQTSPAPPRKAPGQL